jgi:ectoine hydrolase
VPRSFLAENTAAGPAAAEYRQRLADVRARMAERSFAAMVVTDPANIYYLSGYNAWSFYTPQCLIVPAVGPPTLFARAMDAAGAGVTAWLPPEDVEGYPEELVHRPDVHPFGWIAKPAGRPEIGLEGDSQFFSARGYLALQTGLPGVRLEDSRELVNWVRVVKTDYELAQMRIAGSIAQQTMQVALDAIVAGRRQCDAVAEITAAQTRGTAEHGGDYPAIVPMLPTGAGAGTPHLTWTEDRFTPGQATIIEIAGVHRRYHSPLARTIMLGEPPRRLVHTAEVVREGMAEVLAALRPGRTPHEVHAIWNTVIDAHGLSKDSRIGYSIGLGYPPDWGERTISLRPSEHTELEPGMCFHVILGMWMDGWGYELSEPVALVTDGVERLTDLTQDLVIKR